MAARAPNTFFFVAVRVGRCTAWLYEGCKAFRFIYQVSRTESQRNLVDTLQHEWTKGRTLFKQSLFFSFKRDGPGLNKSCPTLLYTFLLLVVYLWIPPSFSGHMFLCLDLFKRCEHFLVFFIQPLYSPVVVGQETWHLGKCRHIACLPMNSLGLPIN